MARILAISKSLSVLEFLIGFTGSSIFSGTKGNVPGRLITVNFLGSAS